MLKDWLSQPCEAHRVIKRDCTCQRPFKLFNFPMKRNMYYPQWIENISDDQNWEPKVRQYICSLHFEDGEPTKEHPCPIPFKIYSLLLSHSPGKIGDSVSYEAQKDFGPVKRGENQKDISNHANAALNKLEDSDDDDEAGRFSDIDALQCVKTEIIEEDEPLQIAGMVSTREYIDGSDVLIKKQKIGTTNKHKHSSEIIKKARVMGTAYTGYKGKQIPERKPGGDCKCKRKCFEIINEDERLEIFNHFNGLGSKDEQDCYLQSFISLAGIKRRRSRTSTGESVKPREATFIYEIPTSSGKQQVCKLAFLSIHSVTRKRVWRLLDLLKEGETPLDRRKKKTLLE
ncbi:uncharacterized protein LOC136024745 isoform X2 [Artemia franciscana]